MTELTHSRRKWYARHTNLLYNCFCENRQCRMRTIKTLSGVDSFGTSLTGDNKIRAEDGLEMFENYAWQS